MPNKKDDKSEDKRDTKDKKNPKDSNDKNKPLRLFGNWTGKTPVSLLYELAQREQWMKPQFDIKRRGTGFKCTVTLRNHNKRTGAMDRVEFISDDSSDNEQLAKHMAATYALHRLTSHLGTAKLLPPSQRDVWERLNDKKQQMNASRAALWYNPDPFKAMQQLKELDSVPAVHEQPAAEFQPWQNYPPVFIDKELRDMLDTLIRANSEILMVESGATVDASDVHKVRRKLLSKGFIKSHVDEALGLKSTYQGAVDWLCMYVPESDLPDAFKPVDSNKIDMQIHNTSSLAEEFIVRRLIDAGFSRQTCLEALLEHKSELLALTALCWKLVDIHPELDAANEDPQVLQDELQVLEAIYGTDGFQTSVLPSGTVVSFDIPIIDTKPVTIDIVVAFGSNYPHNPPAIILKEAGIPAYIKMSIMQQALRETTTFLGTPMIFSIVSWLQENANQIYANPPSLVGLKSGFDKSLVYQTETAQEHRASKNIRRNRRAKHKGDSDEMYSREKNKLISPEYTKMLDTRKKLPSYKFREAICQMLSDNQVLLVCGETGCGKSTQLGQFILENAIEQWQGASCRIICTQPRRISAVALAERVANERCEKVGEIVGYSIKGVSVQSDETRLLFCTTGVMLRMIQSDPELVDISHIIIDEVHERGSNNI